MIRQLAIPVLLTVGAVTLRAQDPAPSFDAVSIKVSQLPSTSKEFVRTSPNTLSMQSITLRTCSMWAYKLKDYQVSGPGWIGVARYDITAKSAAAVPVDQLRQMLQTVLLSRFDLKFHREQKEMSVYALVLAKGGPKLKRSVTEGKPDLRSTMTQVDGLRVPISLLADLLVEPLQRPVLDMTGLEGKFDFHVDYLRFVVDPDNKEERREIGLDPTALVSSALQQQLGLKLERRKTPVSILVIDNASRTPVEN
jgi:uncharacterized protein (TIGR03435 family)